MAARINPVRQKRITAAVALQNRVTTFEGWYKRLVEIGEGTHTAMLEKNRMQFFREIMGFLDEENPLALR
jgi:hypothetical protein